MELHDRSQGNGNDMDFATGSGEDLSTERKILVGCILFIIVFVIGVVAKAIFFGR